MNSTNSDPSPHADETVRRVVTLEEKLMYAQHALEDLNEVVLRQQSDIERLNQELRSLRILAERAIDLAGAEQLPDEKPPHY